MFNIGAKANPIARGRAAATSYVNLAPVWTTVPTIQFTQGTGGNSSIASFVTDPNPGETVTFAVQSGALPSGITLSSAGVYQYSGVGGAATGSIIVRATDNGVPALSADSNAHSVQILSNLAWTGTPPTTFTEGVAGQVNLGLFVAGYNAATDVFSISGNPAWLTLTGTGGVLLTADGTQTDGGAGDGASIILGVSRSGGAYVYTGTLTVTVNAAPATFGSIDDLAFEGRFGVLWTDPQMGVSGSFWTGKHTAWRYCTFDQKIYGFGGDGIYPGSNIPVQDGNIHFPRFTLDANKQPTFDIYYPWMGETGKDFPIAADDHSFVWDSSRNVFWCAGGYSGGPLLDTTYPGRTVVGNPLRAGTYLWKYTPATAQWENMGLLSTAWPASAGVYGQRISYASAHDLLVYVRPDGGAFARVFWYNCATGVSGFKSTTFALGANGPSDHPTIYDPVNDELIFLCFAGAPLGFHAVKLTNIVTAGSLPVRTLLSVGNDFIGQTPMWIRNRRLYVSVAPFYSKYWARLTGGLPSATSNTGRGLGIYEVTLDDATPQMSKCSAAISRNLTTTSSGFPTPFTFNEGAYSDAADAAIATQINGTDQVSVYRYSPPSWIPAEGNVKALTTDWTGSSANNTLWTVFEGQLDKMSGGGGNNPTAWMSGAYCRDLGCNGSMLFQGGGDQDYYGNEVYCFNFDSRRFYRLSNRCVAMTGGDAGGRAIDYAADPASAWYFNASLCEHGPLVADSALTDGGVNWGLLPYDVNGNQATQPGVPHLYDGAVWIPGSFIGNERGAFVRPFSKFVYGGSARTSRAHYFDLDRMQWGRLTTNAAGNTDPLPLSAFNETDGLIYWTSGYVRLSDKTQNAANIFGGSEPFDTSMEYDPVRRLLVYANGTNIQATNVDSFGSKLPLAKNVTGTIWSTQVWGGIVYCSHLDCFFYYNSRAGGPGGTPAPDKIWKIVPPVGSWASDSGTAAQKRTIALAGTWQVTEITMGGDPIVHNNQLTYGNIAYVPKLKCVAIHIPGGNMYLYRPVGL